MSFCALMTVVTHNAEHPICCHQMHEVSIWIIYAPGATYQTAAVTMRVLYESALTGMSSCDTSYRHVSVDNHW